MATFTLFQAHYRRAEAIRSICALPVVIEAGFSIEGGVCGAIGDYNFCYRSSQNIKALCEAIIMAVDYCEFLPMCTCGTGKKTQQLFMCSY